MRGGRVRGGGVRGGGVRGGTLICLRQPLGGILADQRVHLKAIGPCPPQQRVIGELTQRVAIGAGHDPRGLDVKAATEDRQTGQGVPFARSKQPPGLVEYRAQAAMTFRRIEPFRGQDIETRGDLISNALKGVLAHPGRRHFDRQRIALDQTADARGAAGRDGDARMRARRALGKQSLGVGLREPAEHEQPLRPQIEPLPGGDDELQFGCRLQQRGDLRRGARHLFHVVQRNEQLFVAQPGVELRARLGAGDVGHGEGGDEGVDQILGRASPGQRHEDRATQKIGRHGPGRLNREARLAAAPDPGQGQQLAARIAQALGEPGQLGLPPHKRCLRRGDLARLIRQPNALSQCACFGIGRNIQLFLQDARTGLILRQGAGSLPQAGMEAHQFAVRALAQRVDLQQARGEINASPMVTVAPGGIDQRIEHLDLQAAQALALQHHPFFETPSFGQAQTRQEIAAVQARGLEEQRAIGLAGVAQSGLSGGLEVGHIEREGAREVHSDGIAVGLDEGAQTPPQAVDDDPEIAGRLGLVPLIPQQIGQRFARLRPAGAGEIHQQSFGPARYEIVDRPAIQGKR